MEIRHEEVFIAYRAGLILNEVSGIGYQRWELNIAREIAAFKQETLFFSLDADGLNRVSICSTNAPNH